MLLVRLVAVSHAPVSPARPRPGMVPCPVDTRIAGPFPGMSLDAMARNLCLVGEKRSRVGEGICGVRMPLPLPARPRARHGARRTSPRPACPASSLYGVMNSRVGPRVSVQNCTPGASVWPSRCVLGRGGEDRPRCTQAFCAITATQRLPEIPPDATHAGLASTGPLCADVSHDQPFERRAAVSQCCDRHPAGSDRRYGRTPRLCPQRHGIHISGGVSLQEGRRPTGSTRPSPAHSALLVCHERP